MIRRALNGKPLSSRYCLAGQKASLICSRECTPVTQAFVLDLHMTLSQFIMTLCFLNRPGVSG